MVLSQRICAHKVFLVVFNQSRCYCNILDIRSKGIPFLPLLTDAERSPSSCWTVSVRLCTRFVVRCDDDVLFELVCIEFCVQCVDDLAAFEALETEELREAEGEGAMMTFHIFFKAGAQCVRIWKVCFRLLSSRSCSTFRYLLFLFFW